MSTSPSSAVLTTTTFMPAMTALAALVPCAEDGMRQTVRCSSPLARWYARTARSPANSPCEPAFGWIETASYPVTSARRSSSSRMRVRKPCACSAYAKGCSAPNSGQVIDSISVVAFSFMVQEPSGIMPRSSA